MLRDEKVFLLGEDIADLGGGFKVTAGLVDEFGPRPGEKHPYFRGGHRWSGFRSIPDRDEADSRFNLH